MKLKRSYQVRPSCPSCSCCPRRAHVPSLSPGLFVGPFQPSWRLATLQALGITHILCIAESREQCVRFCVRNAACPANLFPPPSTGRHLFSARFPDNFAYLILEVRDADDQNLIRIFPR